MAVERKVLPRTAMPTISPSSVRVASAALTETVLSPFASVARGVTSSKDSPSRNAVSAARPFPVAVRGQALLT